MLVECNQSDSSPLTGSWRNTIYLHILSLLFHHNTCLAVRPSPFGLQMIAHLRHGNKSNLLTYIAAALLLLWPTSIFFLPVSLLFCEIEQISHFKVKFSLWLIEHENKTVEVQLHAFLTSAIDEGKWTASRSGYFTPMEKSPPPYSSSRRQLWSIE